MSMEGFTTFCPVITSIRTITNEEFDLFDLDIKSEIENFAWEDALFFDLSPEEDEAVICTICIHEYQEAKGTRRFSERVMENKLWCHHFTMDGSRDDDMVPQNVTNNRKRPRAECSTQQPKRRRAQPKRQAQPKRRPGQTKRRRVPSTRPSTNDNMLAVQEPVVIVQNIDVVEEQIEEQMKKYLAQSSDCTTLTNFLSLVNVSKINID